MTSDDTIEDALMIVQFYIMGEVFLIGVTVHLLFLFSLQETLRSVILPPYGSLKLNNDTNYLMTSEDPVEIR